MEEFDIEVPLDTVMAAEPVGSPKVISAWAAAQMGHRLVTAFRTQDRNSAMHTAMEIADMLTARALEIDSTLIETGEVDASERQQIYSALDEDDRRVLIRLHQERPMPAEVGSLQPIFDHLIRLGLLTGKTTLTARGQQIAAGVLRHWPKSKAV
ncbi:hypothetical protein DOMOVOI_01630 [Brevundimonas phage vB_BpoS-Domovoi]|uniref:Uncharacterized protein n=1 Tax=Brevundimonas phage vB_BpoS-Domovoi TaxID=2948598 RepID=A0A9E7SMA5_9CAUD|nr:hypothetical protein DOMOVOI_01630 [Brevundimonas phage vB_BpoS-Domovoi]